MGNKTIAKIVEHAEIRERNRIIKLLENLIPDMHTPDDNCEDCWFIHHTIARIKEETK